MKRMCSRMCLLLLSCVFLTAGCEKSGGGGIADGHDFGENDRNVYVAMGDSITHGYGATVPYPAVLSSMLSKTVINRGVDGARASQGLSSVNGILASYKPGFVLILYGANDAIHGTDPAQVTEQLRGIIRAAKANKTIPVIATCTPHIAGHAGSNSGIISLNVRIRSLAGEEGVKVVDLENSFVGHDEYYQSDGLHPNNTGLSVIAADFFDFVQ